MRHRLGILLQRTLETARLGRRRPMAHSGVIENPGSDKQTGSNAPDNTDLTAGRAMPHYHPPVSCPAGRHRQWGLTGYGKTPLSYQDVPGFLDPGQVRNLEGSVPSRKSTQGLMWHSARDGTEAGVTEPRDRRLRLWGLRAGVARGDFVEKGGCRRGRADRATIGETQARPSGFLRLGLSPGNAGSVRAKVGEVRFVAESYAPGASATCDGGSPRLASQPDLRMAALVSNACGSGRARPWNLFLW
jgi:hypothetical protein